MIQLVKDQNDNKRRENERKNEYYENIFRVKKEEKTHTIKGIK